MLRVNERHWHAPPAAPPRAFPSAPCRCWNQQLRNWVTSYNPILTATYSTLGATSRTPTSSPRHPHSEVQLMTRGVTGGRLKLAVGKDGKWNKPSAVYNNICYEMIRTRNLAGQSTDLELQSGHGSDFINYLYIMMCHTLLLRLISKNIK